MLVALIACVSHYQHMTCCRVCSGCYGTDPPASPAALHWCQEEDRRGTACAGKAFVGAQQDNVMPCSPAMLHLVFIRVCPPLGHPVTRTCTRSCEESPSCCRAWKGTRQCWQQARAFSDKNFLLCSASTSARCNLKAATTGYILINWSVSDI